MSDTQNPIKVLLAPTANANVVTVDYDDPSTQYPTSNVKMNNLAFVSLNIPASLVGKKTRLAWDGVSTPLIGLTDALGNTVTPTKIADGNNNTGILFTPNCAGTWYVTFAATPTAFDVKNINLSLNEYFYYSTLTSTSVFWARLNSATGILSDIKSFDIGKGNITQIALDPNGKYLYASHFTAGMVTAFSIYQDGSVGGAISPALVSNPNLITVFPDGKHVAISNTTVNSPTVYSFALDTGSQTLTKISTAPTKVTGQTITGLAFNRRNNVLYAINQSSTSAINQYMTLFSYEAGTGILVPVNTYGNGYATNSSENISTITITPDFRNLLIGYFYSDSMMNTKTILSFSTDANGLTSGSTDLLPNVLTANAMYLAIDPKGRIIACYLGGDLYYLPYNMATQMVQASSPIKFAPNYLITTFDPEGKFAYASGSAIANNEIMRFPITQNSINKDNGII